jgi:hypothetical protein
VFIASPPTSKCLETIGILEEVVRRHPDELRLVVFKRGMDAFPEEPSMGMNTLIQKGTAVPAIVVNGMFFLSCKVPKLEDLEARLQEVFLRTGAK